MTKKEQLKSAIMETLQETKLLEESVIGRTKYYIRKYSGSKRRSLRKKLSDQGQKQHALLMSLGRYRDQAKKAGEKADAQAINRTIVKVHKNWKRNRQRLGGTSSEDAFTDIMSPFSRGVSAATARWVHGATGSKYFGRKLNSIRRGCYGQS